MLKLTRLDHRTVAINPDHIAWVEATPDTTLCLIGDRKIIVRESLDEVIERFTTARAKMGGTGPINVPSMPPPSSSGRRSLQPSRPSGAFNRPALDAAMIAPSIIDEDG
ncbi:MAG: flagellar FlbD family protein [Labilithrix sp.]|nr:flagellar FlbD family protein [Labilithrix sp.]MCW5817660.1 flagellar FlbD family protein [Labilithrix sp.]